MVELEPFFFARRRDTFFCLSKIKYPNKKTPHTTACGYPALLINKGVCGTRAFSAQTVLDENSFIDCVVPVLGMPTKCPLFHSDLGVIGVAQGERKPAKHHRHSDESRNPATLFPHPLRERARERVKWWSKNPIFRTQTVLAAYHMPLKLKTRQGGLKWWVLVFLQVILAN